MLVSGPKNINLCSSYGKKLILDNKGKVDLVSSKLELNNYIKVI